MSIIPTMVQKAAASVRFYAVPVENGITWQALGKAAAPDIGELRLDPMGGFTVPQSLLGRVLSEEACAFGEFLFFSLAKYERRANKTLLEARVREEQERELRARGTERLPKAAANEIRKMVTEALLMEAQPCIGGVHACACSGRGLLMATAVSDREHDAFVCAVRGATGTMPVMMVPDILLHVIAGIAPGDLPRVPFFMDAPDSDLGAEFLTWLWWRFETEGGAVETDSGFHFGYCINGPLRLAGKPGGGCGCEKTVVADGVPTSAPECFNAFMSGKLLTGCLFALAIGDEVMRATVSSDFAFRSLKVPKPTEFDGQAEYTFIRTRAMFTFWEAWTGLFCKFVEVRKNGSAWAACVGKIQNWVQERLAVCSARNG